MAKIPVSFGVVRPLLTATWKGQVTKQEFAEMIAHKMGVRISDDFVDVFEEVRGCRMTVNDAYQELRRLKEEQDEMAEETRQKAAAGV
jgi:hypothetical protein